MSMLGIGLGGFMDGFESGMDMRKKFDDRRREAKNRNAIDKINTDTKSAFDQAVDSGTADPNGFEGFWKQYALPKLKNQLILQGDYSRAAALQKWGESDAALRGGKLFASAMIKAQTGDAAGALRDALEAAQVKGYMDHGFELKGQENIVDQGGNLVGFRLSLKTPDGDDITQDVPVGDVPKLVATFANPQAAWESQTEAKAAAKKRKEGLEDYETKKKIDRKYKDDDSDYAKRYADVRGDLMKNDLDFADLSPEEKDKRVRDELGAADAYAASRKGQTQPMGLGGGTGSPAGAPEPAQRIIVDRGTGARVPANAAPAQAATPAAAPTPTPRPQPPQPQPSQAGGLGLAQSPSSPGNSKAQAIADAIQAAQQGRSREAIERRLEQAGVTQEEWQAAIKQSKRTPAAPIGLGQ